MAVSQLNAQHTIVGRREVREGVSGKSSYNTTSTFYGSSELNNSTRLVYFFNLLGLVLNSDTDYQDVARYSMRLDYVNE